MSTFDKLTKPRSEWRHLLTPEQYAVLFEEATERPFSHPLNDEKRAGTFLCAACFLPLFASDAKFDSRTGWPSFTQPIQGHIGMKRDFKLIWPRTEYNCSRCGGTKDTSSTMDPHPQGSAGATTVWLSSSFWQESPCQRSGYKQVRLLLTRAAADLRKTAAPAAERCR